MLFLFRLILNIDGHGLEFIISIQFSAAQAVFVTGADIIVF
jgi:hypothetical protein